MAFAAAMGVDFAISFVTMAAALAPVGDKPVAKIGIGSTAFGAKEDARTNGVTPNLYLYDTHGKRFAKHESGDLIEDGANDQKDFIVLDGAQKTTEPEYLTIQARTNDATCVSYVTVTGASSGGRRTWHAGYAKTCSEQGGGGFWYPSPEKVPETEFRPGCVWLSNDDRFLQAISVHLPSFGFAEQDQAGPTAMQFKDYPQTLCQAPGRMSLYKTFDGEQPDCIPYYDKLEANAKFEKADADEEKGKIEGFDKDFQAMVDGHTLPARKFFFKPNRKAKSFERTCDYSKHKLFNQEMQPGKTKVTDTPLARVQKEADRKKKEEEAAEAEARKKVEDQLNEEGRNPNGAPPGQGSFGGVAGLIPADQAGKPVDPAEAAKNLEKFKEEQAKNPKPATTALPSQPTGNPTDPTVDFKRRAKRSIQQGQQDEEMKDMLTRREQLRVKGDYCVDQLRISHHAEHSARELCSMERSWGPDFVSVTEGLYCDMCERDLYPLCANEQQTNCFDVDERVLRGSESLWQRVKKYVTVEVWRE